MATARKTEIRSVISRSLKRGKKQIVIKQGKTMTLGWVGYRLQCGCQEGEIFLGFSLGASSLNKYLLNEWMDLYSKIIFKKFCWKPRAKSNNLHTPHAHSLGLKIKGWKNISQGKTDTKGKYGNISIRQKKFKAKWVKVNQKQYFTWPFSWEAQANQLNRWGQSVRGQDTKLTCTN